MVAQRGSGIAGKAVSKTKPAPAASRPAELSAGAPTRKRLSFKDEHALKMLPDRIAALSAEARQMEALLSDPNLYRRDPAKFATTGEALAKARADIAGLEEEWLRIKSLREAFDTSAGAGVAREPARLRLLLGRRE